MATDPFLDGLLSTMRRNGTAYSHAIEREIREHDPARAPERIGALQKALGARIDGDPFFEGEALERIDAEEPDPVREAEKRMIKRTENAYRTPRPNATSRTDAPQEQSSEPDPVAAARERMKARTANRHKA